LWSIPWNFYFSAYKYCSFTICFLLALVYPQAEEMINEVRDAFKANLKSLTWMDKETRDAAESKADAITDMIGEFLCGLTTKQ
jgi:hypothetical protein